VTNVIGCSAVVSTVRSTDNASITIPLLCLISIRFLSMTMERRELLTWVGIGIVVADTSLGSDGGFTPWGEK